MSDSTQLDPLSGLPVEPSYTDPLTGLKVKRSDLSKFADGSVTQNLFGASSTGDFGKYADYGLGVSAGSVDYEEIRAQRQGNWEKFSRGIGKMGVTAASSFVNTFTGMAGLLDYATDLSVPRNQKSLARYEAKHARTIDTEKWREAARESMPHYYTQEELSKVGTPGGIFTMNFLTDKAFDGLGFLLGTAASIYATGGLGVIGRAGQALKLSRALAAYRTGKTLASGASIGKALATYRNTRATAQKVGSGLAYLEGSFYSSLGEAALEGRETGKVTYEKLVKQAQDRKAFNGEDPTLTAQEMQQIKLQAQEAEAAAFYGNVAVLTATNAITFRGLLRPFAKSRVKSNWLRRTTKAEQAAGKGAVVDRLADLPVGLRQVAQAGRFMAPMFKTSATEGFEEASQYAIQEGVTEYQMAKMEDAGLGELAESLITQSRINAFDKEFGALGEAFPGILTKGAQTFTNPEAREQYIIGALIGLVGGGRTSVRESQAAREKRDIQEKLFNDPKFYQLSENSEKAGVESAYLKAMDEAEARGDEELYNYYQKRLRAAQILRHYEAGSLDMFREMIEDAKTLPEKEFKELFGYEEKQKVDQNKVIDDIIEQSKEVEKTADAIDTLFTTAKVQGGSRLFMSKEDKEFEDEKLRDEALYRQFLKQEASTIDLVQGSIGEVLDQIEAIFPDSDLTIEVEQKDGQKRTVNMKQRLRDYSRARFGSLIDTENVSMVGPGLAKNIANLLIEAQKKLVAGEISPVQYELFDAKVAELTRLINAKNNASTALRNLLRDPETRDLAISRAKLVETMARQAKIDEVVDTAIADTVTPEELENKMAGFKQSGVSREAMIRAKDEVRKRKSETASARSTWDTMTRTDVVNLKNLSPLQEKLRTTYLKDRTQEEPKRDTAEAARKRQAARQAKERQNQKQDDTAAGQTKQGQQQDSGEGATGSGANNASNQADALLTTANGQREVVLTQDGKVVVSSEGTPMPNDLHSQRTVDGKPVIDRADLLDTEEVKAGTEVELVVVEDSWWLENRNKAEFANQAEHIPIYVRVPGKGIIGVLTANNSALRRTVYEEFKKGEQGQTVTVQIEKKHLNNRNNARVEQQDGTTVPFLSNVIEVYGPGVAIGVIKFDRESPTEKQIVVSTPAGASPQDIAALNLAADQAKARLGKVFPGTVLAFYKDSNGAYRYNVLQTAKLNEAEQEEALKLLQESSDEAAYQRLIDLVGFNTLDPGNFNLNPELFLSVESDFLPGTNKRIIRLAIPIPTSNPKQANSFLVAAIDNQTLAGLVKGELTAADIIKDKAVFGNLIQEVTINEDGNVRTTGVGFQVLKGDVAVEFINSFVQETANLIAKKRRQMNADRLGDPEYVASILNEQRERATTDTTVGSANPVSTDLVRHNGSLFHGIGLSFNSAELKIGGKKVTVKTAPVAAPAPNSNSAQDLFNKAAQERQESEERSAEEKGPEEKSEAERNDEMAEEGSSDPEAAAELDELLKQFEETGEVPGQESEKPPSDDQIDNDAADAPFRLANEAPTKRMNRNQARAWLRERGIPVEFYEIAQQVGNSVAHGYMKNATVYLWNNAEVGTEYHEAFHYVFRTLLNDKQREGLYKEARKKFNLPNATELELEEAMAEDFRDYVFTAEATADTIPGKILKFFKDIFNFIKSIFIDPVSIDQIYSLIESNKFPKKYQRNTQKFQNTTAYRLVDGMKKDAELQKQTIDSISTVFINQLQQIRKDSPELDDKVAIADLLGRSEENKGVIAEFFLLHSITMPDGTYVSEEALAEFVKAKTKPERGVIAKKYGFRVGIPMLDAVMTGALPISMVKGDKAMTKNDRDMAARIFFQVWNNWFDVTDEIGNVDKFGFREATILNLKKYGFTIKGRMKIREGLQQDEDLAQKEETNYDKIYAISHFEQDPIKTVSQEVRLMFSRILNQNPNKLGMYTYTDVDETIRAAVAASVGSLSYEEILGNIQEAAQVHKVLEPVAAYLSSGNVKASDAAALRRFLTKAYTEQRIVQEEMVEEAMQVRLVNSDRKSAAIAWQTTWGREGKQTSVVDRQTAVLKEDTDGNVVFHNNIVNGKDRFTQIKGAILAYNKATTLEAKAEALGDFMWYMSLGMGRTQEEANRRVLAYVQKHGNQEADKMFNITARLAGKVMNVTREGGVIKKISLKEGPVVNFFKAEGSSVKALAEVAAEFTLPTALAYVDGQGKTIYPYNLPTTFSIHLEDLAKGEESELYQLMMQDPSLAMNFGESDKARALMLYLIENKNFEITSFSLDSLMNEVLEQGAIGYNKLSERDSLILRMNAFLNQNQEFAFIPLPVQETRGRMDFLKVPKFGDPVATSMDKAGIPRQGGVANMIRRIVLRDLVRIATNPNINGFHLSGFTDAEVGGLKLSELVQDAMQHPRDPVYKEFFDAVTEQVNNYLNTELLQYKDDFMKELVKYNILAVEDGKYVIPEGSRLDDSKKRYGDANALVESYIITDLIARVEMAQMFRGGLPQFKDVAAFYKRMGLLNTPGDKFLMRGEFQGDENYGMPEVIKEASIQKLNLQDPYHNEIADRIYDMYVKYFIERVGRSQEEAEAEAKALADQYRTTNLDADHTDAQAFISPRMFQYIEQGLARWTPEDDVWFEKYMSGEGEWAAPFTPAYKFYAEQMLIDNGTLIADMQKNSYVVLTKELAEGNELLTAMYNRMMDPNDPIDIINTESAKKGFKGQLFQVDQSAEGAMFDGLQAREMDASKLFMPQIINDKADMEAKMNRQIRKGIPSMVENDVTYTLPDGTTLTGEELLKQYHQTHSDIVDAQYDRLEKELGYDKLKKDPSNPELRLNFLQRVRELIYDNAARNNKIDSNLDKQMIIVEDILQQRYDFNVPISFPVYQREYQNLISALFKTNVHSVKLPGRELVQVAGPGKWKIGDEVRELRHLDIDPKTGRVKHAEIMVSEDIAERLGLEIGTTGVLYRIPNQDYSSNVPSKIVGILPRGYSKTVIVPGNITIQTGSDFDIDKLFALFRNTSPKTKLAENKNRMLDFVEAVLLDPSTAPYLFKPLTQDTLDALASDPEIARDGALPFDHPLVEVRMESNYKSAATLVGGYANGITGWNIAAVAARYADPESDYVSDGIIVDASKHFLLNGVLLNQINVTSPFTGERTLDGMVERLSAALDAAKGLIHNTLNDNEHTLNATVYLKSIGFEDADIVALMTTPLVRQFVEQRRTFPNKGVGTVFNELGIARKTYKKIVKNDKEMETSVVDTAELKEITAAGETDTERAENAFLAFAKAYAAGNSLSEFYKIIAADNLDGMGDYAEKEAYLDVLENYRRGKDGNIVGYTEVEKILEGDAYPMAKAHFRQYQREVEMSTQLFLTASVGVRAFKEQFKEVTGKIKLSEQEHRYIDRAMFYHILTKDGSPLASFMSKDRVRQMLLKPNDNLYTQVQQLLDDVPALEDHAFLGSVVESPGYSDERNRVWGISIENTEKMTAQKRDEVIQSFLDILYNPEKFTAGMENAEEVNGRIQKVAEDLVLNSIITTGLAPSFGSYYNSIPLDFFLKVKNEETGETLMEYYRREEAKVKADKDYFSDFMFDFIQNFGTARVGGRPLVPKMSGAFKLTQDGMQATLRKADQESTDSPLFATKFNRKLGVDKISVYQLQDGVYYKIQSLGIGGKLLELNLRDENGDIVRTSFYNAETGVLETDIVRFKTFSGKSKVVKLQNRKGDTRGRVLPAARVKKELNQPSDSKNIDKACNS